MTVESTKPPSFAVGAMVRETPDVIERFAAYNVALGAERVYLVHDGPLTELLDQGVTFPPDVAEKVCMIGADDDVWQATTGTRPHNFVRRQRTILTYLFDRSESDWIFCCDADEFLVLNEPVGAFLDRIPSDIDSFRVDNVEAVWGSGDDQDRAFDCTLFRKSGDGSLATRIRLWMALGLTRPLFSEAGLAGYTGGKSFHRRGADIDEVRAHYASKDGEIASVWLPETEAEDPSVLVAHFDAISFPRWKEKFVNRKAVRIGGPRRRKLARLLNLAFAVRLDRWLFRRLNCLTARQERILGSNLVFRYNVFSAPDAANTIEK